MRQTGKPGKNKLKHRHNPDVIDRDKYRRDEKNLCNKTQKDKLFLKVFTMQEWRDEHYTYILFYSPFCLSFIHYF